MKPSRRRFLQLASGAVALSAVSPSAQAQAYPNRPVRIIIGYTPGGSADITGRLMGHARIPSHQKHDRSVCNADEPSVFAKEFLNASKDAGFDAKRHPSLGRWEALRYAYPAAPVK